MNLNKSTVLCMFFIFGGNFSRNLKSLQNKTFLKGENKINLISSSPLQLTHCKIQMTHNPIKK